MKALDRLRCRSTALRLLLAMDYIEPGKLRKAMRIARTCYEKTPLDKLEVEDPRTLGKIHYPQVGRVALTDEGRGSVQGLHRAWFSKLSAPKVRILEALIRHYPEALDKVTLAVLAGQSVTSSGFTNNLGNLRSLGLIDYPQTGYVVATDLLFPARL